MQGLGNQISGQRALSNTAQSSARRLNILIGVNVAQISNGYVLSDSNNGYGLGGGYEAGETQFYPTLDELSADAGRFILEAIKRREAEIQEMRRREEEERERWAKQAEVEASAVNIRVAAPGLG